MEKWGQLNLHPQYLLMYSHIQVLQSLSALKYVMIHQKVTGEKNKVMLKTKVKRGKSCEW